MKISEALLISDLPENYPPELRQQAAAVIRELAQRTDYAQAEAVTGQVAALLEQNAKLERFKAFVHRRLDEYGVPADPFPEENAKHGCRISGRLQWLKDSAQVAHPARWFAIAAGMRPRAFLNREDLLQFCTEGGDWIPVQEIAR